MTLNTRTGAHEFDRAMIPDTKLTPPAPRLVPDILQRRALLCPDSDALVVDGLGTLTYAEWEARSNAFGRGLAARGIMPSDRVVLLFKGEEWVEYAIAFFGTLRAGAVAVPLSRDLPSAQVDRILSHCQASAVCGSADQTSLRVAVPVWGVGEVIIGHDRADFQQVVDPASIAQILYTSGTTGLPKGVACSHENLLFGIVTDGPDLLAARESRRSLHSLPIGLNASQLELTRAAHRMATTVILPAFDPEAFAAAASRHRSTVLLLAPAMAIMILNTGSFDRHDLSSVDRIRLTGAPSPPALLRRLAQALPGIAITNEYALTESTPMAITTEYNPARPGSVGRPAPGQLLRIVNPDGRSCKTDEVGEIWLSSRDTPMRFYYENPDSTNDTFVDGWLRTGDLGYVDGDGFLHVTDRRSDMILTGGRNVATLEVEAVLHECPAVAEAAVVGIPHAVLGEYPAAVVVLRMPLTARDLKAFAARTLPPYAVPQTVLFTDRLPRGLSGKVLKKELAERLAAEPRQFVSARTRTEEQVAEIWARVLGLDAVSVDDRFAELGGQSLSLLQIVADLQQHFQVRLQLKEFTVMETIAEFAAYLDACGQSSEPRPHHSGGIRTLLERGCGAHAEQSTPDT
jgi:acyl-CoA synthetase (AMP-forming)/AMP-acid ligase II/acyl carrier protein